MNDLELQDIYIYPIKSLGGIRLSEAKVQSTGLEHDRRWMLIDEAGMFVSQRTHTQLALLQVDLVAEGLFISHKYNNLAPFIVPFKAPATRPITVTIWDDVCEATEVSSEANEWFSKALQMSLRLVYMPATTKRLVDPEFAKSNETVSFADAYPFMMIGQSSLNDLNLRLAHPVLIDRFRPNFVFAGGAPYLEDQLTLFKMGDVIFKGVKPCSRCVLITIDQQLATKGIEPLKTLATYRRVKNKVMFGQNLLQVTGEVIRVGDKIICL